MPAAALFPSLRTKARYRSVVSPVSRTQCHPSPQRFAASTIGALAAAAVRLFGAELAAPEINEAVAKQMMLATIDAKRIPLSLGVTIIQSVSCAS